MSNSTKQNQETHFGFRTVREDEKASLVHDVFASVANRYDVMNDLMSGGLHRLWKQRFVQRLNPQPGERFLDVAGGTGDIAFLIHDRLSSKGGATAGHPSITVSDINPAMLEVGKDRAIDRGILHGLEWNCANAEALPFPDMSFDAYTIAFGIRNVTHIDKALSEAYRVLKPGSRFLCLEFSQVKNPLLARAYDLYSFNVIPMVGRAITGDRDSYQYLVESIRKFPNQEAFQRMIQTAGFTNTSHQNMNSGVVAIHAGWRI